MTFLWSLNGGQKFKFSPTFGRMQNSEFYTQRNVVQNVTFFIRIINPILVRLKHRNSPRVRHEILQRTYGHPTGILYIILASLQGEQRPATALETNEPLHRTSIYCIQ